MKITKQMTFDRVHNFYPDLDGLVPTDAGFERKVVSTAIMPAQDGGYTAVLSTQEVDRDGDVIVASGIDISYYTGLAIWNHNLDALPIGHCRDIVRVGTDTHGVLSFAKEYDFAEDVESLVSQGMLKGISIGYIPKQILLRGSPAFRALAAELGITDPSCKRILTQVELIEVSVVNAGANKNSLIMAMATKSFKPSDATSKALGLDDDATIMLVSLQERVGTLEQRALEVPGTIEAVVEGVVADLVPDPVVEPDPADLVPEVVPDPEPKVLPESKPPETATVDPDLPPVTEEPPVEEPVTEDVVKTPPVIKFTVIRLGGLVRDTKSVQSKAEALAEGRLV